MQCMWFGSLSSKSQTQVLAVVADPSIQVTLTIDEGRGFLVGTVAQATSNRANGISFMSSVYHKSGEQRTCTLNP